MPNCSQSYQQEIADGKNVRNVTCKYCNSIILKPSTGTFATFEYELPLIKQSKITNSDPETETVSLFWAVYDIFTFYNVGFSNTVGNTKYLVCADCEAGPIGYHDTTNLNSYVALTRVDHS